MGKPRNTTGKGYFKVEGTEPLAKRAVSVRLPESVDAELRQMVGSDLSAWLRKTIETQLEKEKSDLTP